MDVALFRVSKGKKRVGGMIHYNLPNGYVEVKAGPDGMASVWDYDIVLMLVSHLTEAMNRYRDGKGKKPGRVFRPRIGDILRFCRKSNGSRQFAEVEAALDRLQGTIIKSVREIKALLRDPDIQVADVARRYGVFRTTLYKHCGVVQPRHQYRR